MKLRTGAEPGTRLQGSTTSLESIGQLSTVLFHLGLIFISDSDNNINTEVNRVKTSDTELE